MSGTVTGGKSAAKTNKERYGKYFYKVQGAKGGSKTMAQGAKPKGFAVAKQCDCDLIYGMHGKQICSGVKGGTISRRGAKK